MFLGDSFGEISFFSGKNRTASAISKSFSSLISINRDEFLRLLVNSPLEYVINNFCLKLKFNNKGKILHDQR